MLFSTYKIVIWYKTRTMYGHNPIASHKTMNRLTNLQPQRSCSLSFTINRIVSDVYQCYSYFMPPKVGILKSDRPSVPPLYVRLSSIICCVQVVTSNQVHIHVLKQLFKTVTQHETSCYDFDPGPSSKIQGHTCKTHVLFM